MSRIDICLYLIIQSIKAEKDWVSVLLDEDIHFERVDENLGPIGYRTLLVWKLKDNNQDHAGQLKAKCNKIVDDVSHLAVLLKAGDLEYGFLYKSTCINYVVFNRHVFSASTLHPNDARDV